MSTLPEPMQGHLPPARRDLAPSAGFASSGEPGLPSLPPTPPVPRFVEGKHRLVGRVDGG